MKTYRAAVIGCGRMGGFIDNEVIGTPGFYPPYSHGGGFYTSERTDLVACSDFRTDLMDEFGRNYGVPPEGQYTDFRKMVASEDLDIVSVATHVEHHAEVVIALAEAGVKAIYCEKGLAPSLGEANAMAEACNRNGTILNMGAQRRYHPGFQKMREIIDSGEIGAVQNLVMTYGAGLFDHGCHVMDLLTYLIDDPHAVWVQGNAPVPPTPSATEVSTATIRVGTASSCSRTALPPTCRIRALRVPGQLRKRRRRHHQRHPGLLPANGGGRPATFKEVEFPHFEMSSPTVNLIDDLARALDTGDPPMGGMESARHGVEIMVAILESHLRGGERITMPLEQSDLRMHRTNRDPMGEGPPLARTQAQRVTCLTPLTGE